MDSFEINKLLGALLGAVFIVFSVGLISDTIFYSPTPSVPGYHIEVPEDVAEAPGEVEEGPNVLALIAEADPSAGESAFRRCVSCHTAEEGGPNRVGPNLWNTVMQPIADADGFSYSAAMRDFAAQEEIWTYEHLAGFLENPRGYVPGTTMSFAGIRDVQEKANLIAYMRTLSNDPAPLPEVAEEGEEVAPENGEAVTEEGGAAVQDEAGTDAEPVEPTPATDGTEVSPETDAGTPAVEGTVGADEAEANGVGGAAQQSEAEDEAQADEDQELEEEQ